MDLDAVLRSQGGVVSRRQVFDVGGGDNLIERRIRRNEWRPIHPGVYVDHTGVPTDEQLRMAAVLYAWPAALAGESALLAYGARTPSHRGVRVAIDSSRRVHSRPDVSVLHVPGLESRALWNLTPPRLRLEDAAVETASRQRMQAGDAAAVAVLSDLCQQRFTTPGRLRDALQGHARLKGRQFLFTVLDDVATGAYSVLEHRYLTQVERAHGLPRAERQGAFTRGARQGFRDVHYVGQRTLVELLTVRLGWGPVSDPCRLAPLMGELLQKRGWRGRVRPCRHCAGDHEGSPAPGAGDPSQMR